MIKLHPSKSHIWGKWDGCTANPMMEAIQPPVDNNDDQKDGLAAHDLAYQMNTSIHPITRESVVGTVSKHGVTITDEMYDSVKVFTDDVHSHMRSSRVFGGDQIGFEQKLSIPSISDLCNGKPDAYLYDNRRNELIVWDYKHGRKAVDAYEFYQGIVYIKGLIDKFKINGLLDQQTTVVIKVIQPRCYKKQSPIDEWRVKASDLRGYFNTLKSKAHEAIHSPVAKSGSHCLSCNARFTCEAALKAGLQLYEAASQVVPLTMSNDALSLQYQIIKRAIEQMEGLESAYKEQLEAKIRKGERVPGFGVKNTQSNLQWSKPDNEVEQMGKLLGHELIAKKLKTPTQAIALGIDESVINQYSKRVPTGVKLVKTDEQLAKRIFSK